MEQKFFKCDQCDWGIKTTIPTGTRMLESHKAAVHSSPAVQWPERMVPLTDEEELKLRRVLWYGHGHNKYLYGDDGEMQCSLCKIEFGDYKRGNLSGITEAADKALFSWANDLKEIAEELKENKDA
jgi:hypothetical protein